MNYNNLRILETDTDNSFIRIFEHTYNPNKYLENFLGYELYLVDNYGYTIDVNNIIILDVEFDINKLTIINLKDNYMKILSTYKHLHREYQLKGIMNEL